MSVTVEEFDEDAVEWIYRSEDSYESRDEFNRKFINSTDYISKYSKLNLTDFELFYPYFTGSIPPNLETDPRPLIKSASQVGAKPSNSFIKFINELASERGY
jgi:hypothetical protein